MRIDAVERAQIGAIELQLIQESARFVEPSYHHDEGQYVDLILGCIAVFIRVF